MGFVAVLERLMPVDRIRCMTNAAPCPLVMTRVALPVVVLEHSKHVTSDIFFSPTFSRGWKTEWLLPAEGSVRSSSELSC